MKAVILRAFLGSTAAVLTYLIAAWLVLTGVSPGGAPPAASMLGMLTAILLPIWIAFALLVEPIALLLTRLRFAHATVALLVGGLAGIWLATSTGGVLLGGGDRILIAVVVATLPAAIFWQVLASPSRR